MEQIEEKIRKHERWREKNCINLIPSENVMSPRVRCLLSSDFGQRYTSREKFYMGTRFLDEIESYGEKTAMEVFGAETANLRPLSGHIADLTALASFTQTGDTIVSVSADDGGYPGTWKSGIPQYLGLRVVGFPFSKRKMNLNATKAEELVRQRRPRMVIFGASLFLFPHPVKALAKVARDVGAHVGYDGSHVLGLIAGKEFQQPLREGASMLFGSTHKSFFGPQGGIILADREHGEIIRQRMFPAFVDNAHWNRVAALTMALAEMKEFGRRYATQVIRNAQALARALADHGLPVMCPSLGFTRSHQVLLDYGDSENGRKVAEKLERANIVTDCDVRLGVCELTRRGMKQNEMLRVAELIKRVVRDGEDPVKVKSEVTRLVAGFQDIHYCFK